MSKIKPDKINFDKDDFVVEVEDIEGEIIQPDKKNKKVTEAELEKNRLEAASNEIIEKAQQKAKEIVDKANEEKVEILEEANAILAKAQQDAKATLDEASKEKDELLSASKEEIEAQRVTSAKEGYDEGYKDGESKLYEELEEKIEAFDTFFKTQYELKNKILKSSSKDILDVIFNISRKILLKEIDGETLSAIIHKTVGLLEKKENINIILSEKYARLLFEFQKKSLTQEIEFNFEDFKQYDNFAILYNPKLSDDTIIVENFKERFDASINAQLDIIIRDVLENTSNGQLEELENEADNEA